MEFKSSVNLAQNLVSRVVVKSSVNSLLWLDGVISLPCFIMSILTSGARGIVLLVVGCIVVFATLVAYFYFMFTNPDRLRSEDYQLKQQALQWMGGDQKHELAEASIEGLVSMKNPEGHPLLETADH